MSKVKTEEEKFPYGKVKFDGKFIPKAKDGLPNGIYVGDSEKLALKEYRTQMKKEKKKVNLNNFMEILKGNK
jgi:hypothetical protein